MSSIDETDLRVLFDIAINSMDFGSGFLDHAEVTVLRRIAVGLGVDPSVATPDTFRASFAHDFTAPKPRKWWPTHLSFEARRHVEPTVITVCGWCGRVETNPVHHGVSTTEPTSPYEDGM